MKWNERDVPDQEGRVAVVTGANTGLGFQTARVLAEHGATVVLAVRDVAKGKKAAARMAGDVTVQELDLTSLESIHATAADLHATHGAIDLLINNAGVMYPPKQTTRDGFELQFGTNHLGHFALTGLVLDLLLHVPDSRVVTVSSLTHRVGGAIHFDDLQWNGPTAAPAPMHRPSSRTSCSLTSCNAGSGDTAPRSRWPRTRVLPAPISCATPRQRSA